MSRDSSPSQPWRCISNAPHSMCSHPVLRKKENNLEDRLTATKRTVLDHTLQAVKYGRYILHLWGWGMKHWLAFNSLSKLSLVIGCTTAPEGRLTCQLKMLYLLSLSDFKGNLFRPCSKSVKPCYRPTSLSTQSGVLRSSVHLLKDHPGHITLAYSSSFKPNSFYSDRQTWAPITVYSACSEEPLQTPGIDAFCWLYCVWSTITSTLLHRHQAHFLNWRKQ